MVTASTNAEGQKLFEQIMLNPMSEDPYSGYHQLRALAPALLTDDGNNLILTRYADCDAALRHRAFGKGNEIQGFRLSPVPEHKLRPMLARMERSMHFANPPEHTRLRQVVSAAFSVQSVDAMRAGIAARIDALLDELAAQDGGDFMSVVAHPLPLQIMADLLGIPESDHLDFGARVAEHTALAEPTIDAEALDRAITAEAELAAYFTDLLRAKRRTPGDDLLSQLVSSDAGESLDEIEMVATAQLLLGAGIETTSNLLGNGMHALLTHPEELNRLREDPGLIPGAVEEILRYASPVHIDARTVLEPVTFLSADLKPGQTVTTLLGAANFDPARFENPDVFDVGRTDNGHIAFASGIHYCMGAHLSRLEIGQFMNRLLSRYSGVALAGPARRRPRLGLRGFASLPVSLER
ncbi:cytochrome P450 [Streptomyces coeruleorubidus]|uniref:cytochrome P450 n=1 Tax=Streptomyces coeruleorubidus TaxID=116188 RepID=UPI0037A4D2D1